MKLSSITLFILLSAVVTFSLLFRVNTTQPASAYLNIQTPTPTKTIVKSPTKTKSKTPTPHLLTPTPLPTFTKEAPFNDPAKYRLVKQDQNKLLDMIAVLDQQWNKTKEEETWIYAQTGINAEKRFIGLLEQQLLFLYPDIPDREKWEWKTALDLATGGQQEASTIIARLIKQTLDRDPSVVSKTYPKIFGEGFSISFQKVPDLFEGQPDSWIAQVIAEATDAGGGAVYSIRKNRDNTFEVDYIGGYWLPYWGHYLEFYTHTTSSKTHSDVTIWQWSSHGTGFYFTEAWLCTYQWQDQKWVPMLTNTVSDAVGTFGLDFPLNKTCFIDNGGFDEPVFQSSDNSKSFDSIQVSRPMDPYSCAWTIEYTFRKVQDEYVQLANIKNIEPELTSLSELSCLTTAWDYADIIKNKQDVVIFMDYLVGNWAILSNQTWEGRYTIQDIYGNTFYTRLQFQLGRFYALNGEIEKAKAALTKIANNTPYNSNRWTYIAYHYLRNICDIQKAEEGLKLDLASTSGSCKHRCDPVPLFDRALSELAETGNLQGVKKDILVSITNEEPSCYGNRNYRCVELFYLLGLANELDGNESEAVNAYWLVWKNFPNSLFAVAAQQKLERRK